MSTPSTLPWTLPGCCLPSADTGVDPSECYPYSGRTPANTGDLGSPLAVVRVPGTEKAQPWGARRRWLLLVGSFSRSAF